MTLKLTGLVAATHTPFAGDGSLRLDAIEKQAEHLLRNGVQTAFIGGTTGESHSLTVDERLALADRWAKVVQGSPLRVVVHVGANCLADCRALAEQAQRLGAAAVAALAPSYFKPKSLEALIACCADVAAAAPELPFYFYDIPAFTAVQFSMPEFLAVAPKSVPTLAGIKFTNPDMTSFQKCLRVDSGRFDVPWGIDEYLLGATALGAAGAVGSTYNFAAPIAHRILEAFARNDLPTARTEQFRLVQLIDVLASHGYMPAAKALMGFLGVDVGPARLPHGALSPDQTKRLRAEIETLGAFEWIGA